FENLVATLRHSANLFHSRSPLSCAFERVDHWERNASRWRPAFSSHLINAAVTGNLKSIQGLVRLRDAPNTASFYHSVMGEKTTEPGRPKWWLPRCAAIIEILIFIPIAISHPDTVFFLGIFLILPILFVVSIVLVVLFCRSAFGSGRFRPLPLLTTLAIIWL